MTIFAAVPGSEGRSTIETRASWAVCLTALAIAAVSFAAPAITVVGLKSIAADLGGERSVPALAYSLAWLGASVGGIAMGQAAERFGVRATVIFGSLMIATGLRCWRKAPSPLALEAMRARWTPCGFIPILRRRSCALGPS